MIFFDDGSPEVEYPSDADFDSESEDESENEEEEDGGVETHDSGAGDEAATFCTGDEIPRVQRKHAREERREIRAQKTVCGAYSMPIHDAMFFSCALCFWCRAQRRRVQEYYYSGSFYGAPASSLLYELAQQVNKGCNHILWLAIVGATERFLSQRNDTDAYDELVAYYQQQVLAQNAGAATYTISNDSPP